jgi:anti-anti-sigma factor
MEFSTERVESAAILHLSGRLTVDADEAWIRAAADAGTRNGVRHVLLHMGRVRQLDCSGIGRLLRLREQLHRERRTCALVAVDRRQRRLLELAGLHRVFRMFDDCGEAMLVLGIRVERLPVPQAVEAVPLGAMARGRMAAVWHSWGGWTETECVS